MCFATTCEFKPSSLFFGWKSHQSTSIFMNSLQQYFTERHLCYWSFSVCIDIKCLRFFFSWNSYMLFCAVFKEDKFQTSKLRNKNNIIMTLNLQWFNGYFIYLFWALELGQKKKKCYCRWSQLTDILWAS